MISGTRVSSKPIFEIKYRDDLAISLVVEATSSLIRSSVDTKKKVLGLGESRLDEALHGVTWRLVRKASAQRFPPPRPKAEKAKCCSTGVFITDYK